jgi:N-acetylglucosamine transport system permease protein
MYRRRQWRIIVPFLLPALILYVLFVVYPDANAFWVSLHRWRGLREMTFVGLENFARMPTDPVFTAALGHNLWYMVVNTVGTIVVALTVAVVLTGKIRGAGFFRTIYFFPATISAVAIAAVWKMIYNPIWGPPALLFQKLGLDPPLFLGDEALLQPSIAAVVIWGAVGFHMTLYIAGIQNIPPDFYDAAKIDGANEWQLFRHITIPLLWPVLRVSMVFLLIFGLNIFVTIMVMMAGYAPGLATSAQVLATFLYERAFGWAQYGYGTAIGIVLFTMTMIITLISLALTRREQVELS